MKVYVLFNIDRCDYEARIKAIVSSKSDAEQWDKTDGGHFEEFTLDDITEVSWAIQKLERVNQ